MVRAYALMHDGLSVATTMGFTAVDGLVMGTRCGAIDPGVLIYLMDAYGMDARALEKLIYRESGLLGVSGISSDMRTLRASSDAAAVEAIRLFVYRIIRELGSLCAALGGLDAFVFTGGIGGKRCVHPRRRGGRMPMAWLGYRPRPKRRWRWPHKFGELPRFSLGHSDG
jgi:acetate kinase